MTLKPPISVDDHLAGNADARMTLVEYGDYQCPHCADDGSRDEESMTLAIRRALRSAGAT